MKFALQILLHCRRSTLLATTVITLGLLTSCSDYTWTLNERVVHVPPELLSDIRVSDEALRDCLQQAIKDQDVERVGQVELLNCSDAGISSLAGLEQFNGLQRINLDDNRIVEGDALALLPRLQLVNLRNNSLTTVAPLICAQRLDELARERVMREAQSMARLGAHPNLVAIHDIGEEDGNPHLVEEFMAGGTVASLLEGGTPDVERTLAVATDVCRALSFIHGQGLRPRGLNRHQPR